MNKKTTKFILFIILLCLIYFLGIYLFQEKFLFGPDTKYKTPQEAGTSEFVEMPITARDGTQIMCWYYEGDKDKPLILFFHGNTGQISKFAPTMTAVTSEGYSVAMTEYRSFGNTKGKISENNVFSDAVQFYDYFKNKTQNKIIAYGYSFGCAAVMGLSVYRHLDGIVLTAPFSSFYQEVKDYPVPFAYIVLKDKYLSDKYVKSVDCPILFIHGTKDKLIKSSHSQKLYDLTPVKNKELVFVEGINHHDIFFKKENLPYIMQWLKQFN